MSVLNIYTDGRNGNTSVSINVLNQCPHCGTVMEPKAITSRTFKYNDNSAILVILLAPCCKKHFMSGYLCVDLFSENSKPPFECELLFTYPNLKPKKLANSFYELSPRFIDLYNQSYTAEQNGHIELAATGYRNALEILIKDYAIKKLCKPQDEVIKKSLYQAIHEYMPNALLTNSANVIRVLGNDYTHYDRKYPQHDFNILTEFIEAFLSIMNFHLISLEPPADIPGQPST